MGESELKIALQREGDEQIHAIWQKVETDVFTQRKSVDMQRQELRIAADQQLQAEIVSMSNTLRFSAQARARDRQLHAEVVLAKRLLQLANQLLPELADVDRDKVWQALLGELPRSNWTSLKIHPADRERAEKAFPGVSIECDDALGGGMIVTSADDVIRIDNSLRCRLLRAWPEMLPELMAELRMRVDNDESVDNRKTD